MGMPVMRCGDNIRRINKDRFIEDTTAILNARRIFIDSNVTRNITIAYELYQEVLAEKDDNEMLAPEIKCPECGSKNMVRKGKCGMSEGHEFCKDCDYEKFF